MSNRFNRDLIKILENEDSRFFSEEMEVMAHRVLTFFFDDIKLHKGTGPKALSDLTSQSR